MTYGYGWCPQGTDERDLQYVPRGTNGVPLPGRFSLRTSPHNGPVLNQGQLGTCVPNSNADAFRFVMGVNGLPQVLPSRLYIYAEGRLAEGSPLSQDTGMQVRTALSVLAAGVPPEVDDPYSDANPGPFQNAPTATEKSEASERAIDYLSIDPLGPGCPLRTCLFEGYPFTFGFSVPAGLESEAMASGQQTFLPLPGPGNELIDEGHGVECVGFDFTCTTFPHPAFEIKNSWTSDWCDDGYFWLDWRYFGTRSMQALATDLWTIRAAS